MVNHLFDSKMIFNLTLNLFFINHSTWNSIINERTCTLCIEVLLIYMLRVNAISFLTLKYSLLILNTLTVYWHLSFNINLSKDEVINSKELFEWPRGKLTNCHMEHIIWYVWQTVRIDLPWRKHCQVLWTQGLKFSL